MNADEIKELQIGLADYFAKRAEQATAEVKMPVVNPKASAAQNAAAEEAYVDALLGKSHLTNDEVQYLQDGIIAYAREVRRDRL